MTVLNIILSVILFILKWTGIILLAVLLLALFIIAAVLLVPVRYKAGGDVDIGGSDKPKINGEAGISWLLHSISVKIRLKDNKPVYHIKIFGIKISDSSKPKKKKKSKSSNSDKTKHALTDLEEEAGHTEEKNVPENADVRGAGDMRDVNEKVIIAGTQEQSADENSDEKAKKSLFQRLKEKFEKIIEKINNIKFKIIEICDKIKNVKETKEEFAEFITADESVEAIGNIKNSLLKILLHVMPGDFRTDMSFGMEDPAATGQVYGILCIFLGKYGKKIIIRPEFSGVEKTFVKGNFRLKGRIRVIVLLIQAIKIYKIKRLKEFIALIKGKGRKNGR